jgi:N-carbamoylputrescine amidase
LVSIFIDYPIISDINHENVSVRSRVGFLKAVFSSESGEKEVDHFGGGSYVVDPDGQVLAKAGEDDDEIIYAELNSEKIEESSARRHFLEDRRPYFYHNFTMTL